MADTSKIITLKICIGMMKENTRALAFYRSNGFDEEFLLLGKEF